MKAFETISPVISGILFMKSSSGSPCPIDPSRSRVLIS